MQPDWVPYRGFCGPAYESQSRRADAEALINWYVERLESENAKVPYVLYPTPGVMARKDTGFTPNRGLFAQEGRAFAVQAGRLLEFDQAYNITDRGDVGDDGGLTTMTTNGDGGGQLQTTSALKAFVLDLDTGVLTQTVPNAAIQRSHFGGMLNGRFLNLDVTASLFAASEVFDGITYNAFMFAQRSTASDPWRCMIVSTSTSKIYLLGELTSDVWYDAGNSPFPYQPITGTLIPWGIGAPNSAVDVGGRLTWLAQNKNGDRVVVRLSGYTTAQRVSNHAMERAMGSYDRVDNAEAFSYQEDGHEFYVLNFPSANISWVLDDEGGWHQRGTWNPQYGRNDVWHARTHALAFGRHVYGSRFDSSLYEGSILFGTDFANRPLRRMRRTAGIQKGLERLYFPGLRLYLDTGLGLVGGQGVDPKVLYRYSNNGAKTWGNYRERSAGKQGDYDLHVDFLLNGSGYDRVDEIVVSDPIPWRVMGAFLLPDEDVA